MKIDAQTGWYHGAGDAVCFAWIGEGMIAAGEPVEFFAAGSNAEILKMFQMPITYDINGATVANVGYETCARGKLSFSYAEWMAHQLGVKHSLKRPRLELVPMDREMGRAASADVLIFPDCAWQPRKWPDNYFTELGKLLQSSGFSVRFVLEKRRFPFDWFFHCIHEQSWNFVAGAIQSARLVICNESGPAHLAGTIGTPTIAICGPTDARAYAHVSEVTCYSKNSLGCSGCYFAKPYRSSCEVGCHELYRTFPEEIAEFALSILNSQPSTLSEAAA
jgi:Glycosyltransferase family 9 (heptosyltransferase)